MSSFPQPMNLQKAFDETPAALDFVTYGLVAGTVGALTAAGGASKSSMALAISIAVAGGPDTTKLWGGSEIKTGRVVFLAGEDPETVLHQRLHEYGKLGMTESERNALNQNLMIYPLVGVSHDLCDQADFTQLMEVARGARLVIIDTQRRFHSGDENDGGHMAAVMARAEVMAASGPSVMFLHHTSKASAMNGVADAQQAARGSSVITDNARWQAFMATMTEKEAAKLHVAEDNRKRYVRFGYSKLNYCAPLPDRWFMRNSGGILEPVDMSLPESVRRGGKRASKSEQKGKLHAPTF